VSEQSEQILPEELAPVVDGEAIQADEAQPESLDSQAEEAAAERSEEAVEAEVEEAAGQEGGKAESAPEPEVDPVEEFRRQMSSLPGEWYVLHTYSGYEKRVKQDLEVRMHSMNMEDYIFQIEVPMEEVFEIRRGQRKLVSRVRMPGYVLIRMELTDDSWRVVQSTNGVTGFVGNGRTPVALSEDEVVSMLTPVIEAEAAAEAVAAGLPTGTKPATVSPFEVGDAVTLTSEPWAGMPATVSEIDAANQRLTVLMTLVGQETPVELSFGQVRKDD